MSCDKSDPDMYERFGKTVLVHGVRYVSELAYQKEICEELPNNEFFGDCRRERFTTLP